MTLNPIQKHTLVAMAQADAQMSHALVQAHEEHAEVLQGLGESVQSSFAALSTQNDNLQKEVVDLKAQLVMKDTAHEAEQKAMRELFETMQKRMQEMTAKVGDLELVAKEHSHGSTGVIMVNMGTPTPIKFPLERVDKKVN
jgi:TolA-binding protein